MSDEELAAETSADVQSEKSESESKKKRLPEEQSEAVNALVARFAACGRCSFFLAGYRVMVGEDGLETAAAHVEREKLTLTWEFAMRELVSKSYGVQLYLDHYFYNGRCPECGRAFAFQAAQPAAAEDEGDTPPTFTIDY